MKHLKFILLLAVMTFFVVLTGCTSTDSTYIAEPATTVTTITPTETLKVISEPLILKAGEMPDEIIITHEAKPVNENTAVLVYYTLDSKATDSKSNQDGWKFIVTAFAYNTDKVSDFNPKSIQDIINSGVPYQSRNIHLYPKNVYPDKIEISKSPSGQIIDLNKPYNYGILFTRQ
ncbi:hypothetical protein L1994_06595 [Methanomicrobium antiquum]|uniref:Uncharacterized protein n=1 Tax=Methanomicrobium antiquum TaxID=487686 RepID=A0AAF0JKR0_9EURY|nr:hypothetical protein [Methanomicrobium antiquum]MDD3977560.1 hypothetical protein [Methanomicrobium sp.]WFN35829.1 hypothetical protein L1994_06595 [Methanomicrobium antiquum]